MNWEVNSVSSRIVVPIVIAAVDGLCNLLCDE